MLWTRIGLEPCEPAPLRRTGRWCVYDLSLPLISDGRIAVAQLLQDPEQATVCRMDSRGERMVGRVRTLEGQWCMVWDAQHGPCPSVVRFFGRRYLPGDEVGLRPVNSVMTIYRVCDCEHAQQLAAGQRG